MVYTGSHILTELCPQRQYARVGCTLTLLGFQCSRRVPSAFKKSRTIAWRGHHTNTQVVSTSSDDSPNAWEHIAPQMAHGAPPYTTLSAHNA